MVPVSRSRYIHCSEKYPPAIRLAYWRLEDGPIPRMKGEVTAVNKKQEKGYFKNRICRFKST